MAKKSERCHLILEDGSVFEGYAFGARRAASGEVVFNTGMVGYPESLTDPSYKGQILVLTYPLVGNYGVPDGQVVKGLLSGFESDQVQIAGLVVSQYIDDYSHWSSTKSLSDWLGEQDVPGIHGIDTRMLTKRLRDKGVLLGKILLSDEELDFYDPNKENLVSLVSVSEPVVYPGGEIRVTVVDCGCKKSIIRNLLTRGATVVRVPWDYDFSDDDFDGAVISNGPGDPKICRATILNVKKAMEKDRPILGVCMGHQILALAADADTYKLKFGHRGQNQPCVEVGTKRCHITSQNHGYAVDIRTLPADWEPWFTNANDGTNEGIRHRCQPFMSVQFHPEAAPGPVDTNFVFDEFFQMMSERAKKSRAFRAVYAARS